MDFSTRRDSVFDLSQAQPRDDQKMDAIPVPVSGKHPAIEVNRWEDVPDCADPDDRVGVKRAVAVVAVLWATLTLMLAPAIVAVISMAG